MSLFTSKQRIAGTAMSWRSVTNLAPSHSLGEEPHSEAEGRVVLSQDPSDGSVVNTSHLQCVGPNLRVLWRRGPLLLLCGFWPPSVVPPRVAAVSGSLRTPECRLAPRVAAKVIGSEPPSTFRQRGSQLLSQESPNLRVSLVPRGAASC